MQLSIPIWMNSGYSLRACIDSLRHLTNLHYICTDFLVLWCILFVGISKIIPETILRMMNINTV